MFTVTDNEDNLTGERDNLKDALLLAWCHTNHRNAMSDERMKFYVDHFERYGVVMMSYGFYIISVQAK